MNAGVVVHHLLEDYVPDGYTLLDTAQAGDYILKLWEGESHVNGKPVHFREISLNAAGRDFDQASQAQKYTGSIHALGHRQDLLRVVANWLKKFGDLYIGSYEPAKLAFYHKILKRHLRQLNISEPYAAFDECEGKPEYFKISAPAGVIESILEDENVDVNRYVSDLPDVMSQAIDAARKVYVAKIKSGEVDDDNFGEWAEAVVDEIVNKFHLTSNDELVDEKTRNTLLYHVLNR